MQTPTTNCPKLNCSTLQQQNPSSQRRYQQNRDSREKPFKRECTSKKGQQREALQEGMHQQTKEEEPKAA
jgi:hypothetical protein